MEEIKKLTSAIEANFFQILINYPNLSLEDVSQRIKNITLCIEEIIDVKIKQRLEDVQTKE